LDLLMPEEIPQAVAAAVHYRADFVRSERINGGLGVYPYTLGIAARFLSSPCEGQNEGLGK
jgi:cadmium resistance protein CadD (predicted permease)